MKKLLTIAILLTLASCGNAGKNGTNGINGTNGDKGDIGQTGNNGIDGSKGDKGEVGQDGEGGQDSSLKVVQFCAGLVDSYGVAYSERGLCIDGKVYAVYSSKSQAALVELSNGLYSTTTPKGTNCTFTIDSTTCN